MVFNSAETGRLSGAGKVSVWSKRSSILTNGAGRFNGASRIKSPGVISRVILVTPSTRSSTRRLGAFDPGILGNRPVTVT